MALVLQAVAVMCCSFGVAAVDVAAVGVAAVGVEAASLKDIVSAEVGAVRGEVVMLLK